MTLGKYHNFSCCLPQNMATTIEGSQKVEHLTYTELRLSDKSLGNHRIDLRGHVISQLVLLKEMLRSLYSSKFGQFLNKLRKQELPYYSSIIYQGEAQATSSSSQTLDKASPDLCFMCVLQSQGQQEEEAEH